MILYLLSHNCVTENATLCLPCGQYNDLLVRLCLYRACDILIALLLVFLFFAKKLYSRDFYKIVTNQTMRFQSIYQRLWFLRLMCSEHQHGSLPFI